MDKRVRFVYNNFIPSLSPFIRLPPWNPPFGCCNHGGPSAGFDCIPESADHLASYIQHWLASTRNLVWPLVVTRFQPHRRLQQWAYGGTPAMVFSTMDTICKGPKLDG
jgi:hypothetical protein